MKLFDKIKEFLIKRLSPTCGDLMVCNQRLKRELDYYHRMKILTYQEFRDKIKFIQEGYHIQYYYTFFVKVGGFLYRYAVNHYVSFAEHRALSLDLSDIVFKTMYNRYLNAVAFPESLSPTTEGLPL